jgi:pimeloyl-ACP methyl ester carboxylesterase
MKRSQRLAIRFFRTKLNMMARWSPDLAAQSAFKLFGKPRGKRPKSNPPLFAAATQHALEVDSKRVAAYQWSKPGARRVLVLHGFDSSAQNFAAYIQALRQKGLEVWALDAPAHGRSAGETITLPLYAAAIAALEKAFGSFDGYMAHSFGGLAVMHHLEEQPNTQERKVVLIAPATETVSAINLFFDFLQLSPAVRTAFDQLIFQKAGVWPSHFSIPRTLQQVQSSILWIHDRQDDITPYRDLAHLVEAPPPQVEFMITEGLGHRKIYRDPSVMQAVISFL